MRLVKLLWKDGRFAWPPVVLAVLGTAALLVFDWYWRTHETGLSRWF